MSTRLLSRSEVEQLYRKHVASNANPAYLARYDGYDFGARFGDEAVRTMEFPRLVTVLEFERLVRERGIAPERLLMINGGPTGDPELDHLNYGRADFIDYEVDPERCDLHELRPGRDDFDFVLCSQTLEHVYNPLLALENILRVMAGGGHVWTSVPTVSHQHQMPHHFTSGFTPIGLACLCEQAGFEVLEVGQWGNAKYVSHLFDLETFPTYQDLARGAGAARGVRHLLRRLCRLSPASLVADGTRNDFAKPVQTWALARKPGTPQ